jgi:hypothetical protein
MAVAGDISPKDPSRGGADCLVEFVYAATLMVTFFGWSARMRAR